MTRISLLPSRLLGRLAFVAILAISISSTFAGKAGKSWSSEEFSHIVSGVRTTAYTFGGDENGSWPSSNALGKPLKTGKVKSAAADWSRWPVGTRFVVEETGQEYIVDDYGSAMVGTGTIDLFKASSREMNRWGVRNVTIRVLEWGSAELSLRILNERKKHRYIKRMVEDLEAQI